MSANVEFEKACPACGADCPSLSLADVKLYAGDIVVHREWYCTNRELCKRLWERMQRRMDDAGD